MIVPDQVRLTQCSTGREELARIVRLTREDAKTLIDGSWWTDLGPTRASLTDQPDRHWDWRQLVSVNQNRPYTQAYCIKTADGAVQGALLLRVDVWSALESGERAVFVDRLATAPRNRDELVTDPAFRGVGTGLLTYAIALSYSLGFSGRVNLFPVANEQFYGDLGFAATAMTSEGETLFELPATNALSILHDRGLLDA
jgi:hypothetical protein